MAENRQKTSAAPESVFRGLRDRPTPELDERRLWRAIAARLEHPAAPPAPTDAPRPLEGPEAPAPFAAPPPAGPTAHRWPLPVAVAATLALVAGVWLVWALLSSSGEAARIVVLEPPSTAPADATAPLVGEPLALDVRLVRGYDGAAPEDVLAAVADGVGGADALVDARPRIAALLPFEEFGIVGAGSGDLSPGTPLGVSLSSGYRLVASTVEAGSGRAGSVQLRDVELVGAAAQLANADLVLEPGRLYVLGILPAGVETPALILLLRIDRSTGSR